MSETCTVEMIPIREAIVEKKKTELDALIRIVVPEGKVEELRTPVNIGLVIDRSGSMQGAKLEYALQAACYVVDQLETSDKVSVVAYNHDVHTVFKADHPTKKKLIKREISRIHADGRTALHAGWIQGGIEVSEALDSEYMNRVLLLSDGLANVGECNTLVIEQQVKGLVERGVSTSTIGVGEDYNEDLMSAMARGGTGNYWFIRSPEQLPAIFRQELRGLTAVLGRNVELKIKTTKGVRLAKIYNELASIGKHTWRIPDLQKGQTVEILLRLRIDPKSAPANVCSVSIGWDDSDAKVRMQAEADLSVKVVSDGELGEYPVDPDVQEQVAMFEAAELKEEAVRFFDHGDLSQARQTLKKAKVFLRGFPSSHMLRAEMASLDSLDRNLDQRKYAMYRKFSHYGSYGHSHGHYHSMLYPRLCGGPVRGNITNPPQALHLPVEAIVNSCDTSLSDVGMLSRAIHRAAGPQLLEECRAIGHCDYGEAVITKAHNLPVGWVIHTVCPVWLGGQGNEVELLRSCYANILRLAREHGIRALAIPAIGVGAMRFPADLAAATALEVVSRSLTHNRVPATVLFICYDDVTLKYYKDAFTRIVGAM